MKEYPEQPNRTCIFMIDGKCTNANHSQTCNAGADYCFLARFEAQPEQDVKEGLTIIISKLLRDFDSEGHEYPAGLFAKYILSYLFSQGFGDTKQARQEGVMDVVKWIHQSLIPYESALDDWQAFLRKNLTPEQLRELGV